MIMPPRRFLSNPYVLLLAVYTASRVVYYAVGVRFDTWALTCYLQFLDLELLKHDLLRSLYYLHWQSPGYNLLLGIIIKLFPSAYLAAFHALHVAFSTAITCCMFHLMRSIGVRTWLAFAATSLFIVSPGVVLYENFLFYEYPVKFLLAAGAVFLLRHFQCRSAAAAGWFLACVFLLVMVRNQFHLVYYAAVFALLLFFSDKNRKVVAVTGSVFLVLILSLYFKNLVLFGKFTSSTWDEMGLGPLLLHQLTPDEQRLFLSQGKISPAILAQQSEEALKSPVGVPISAYRPYIKLPPKTGIPVLDNEYTSSGTVNYNHIGYLEVQKLYKKDIRFILREHPKAYLRSVAYAWYSYFLPSGDFPFFNQNLPRIRGLERLCDIILCGQFKYTTDRKELRKLYAAGARFSLIWYTGSFLVVGMPALFLFGIWFVYRGVRKRTLERPGALMLGFLLFNIFYVTMTSNFLSSFETNRYRFPIDALYMVLFALALEKVVQRVASIRGKAA